MYPQFQFLIEWPTCSVPDLRRAYSGLTILPGGLDPNTGATINQITLKSPDGNTNSSTSARAFYLQYLRLGYGLGCLRSPSKFNLYL